MPLKIIFAMYCICAVNKPGPELFPCVKRLFISAENDRRNTVDFRPSSSFLQETQHYLRHSEYLYHGVLQVRRSKHYAVFFYFSLELGNCVDKNLS